MKPQVKCAQCGQMIDLDQVDDLCAVCRENERYQDWAENEQRRDEQEKREVRKHDS